MTLEGEQSPNSIVTHFPKGTVHTKEFKPLSLPHVTTAPLLVTLSEQLEHFRIALRLQGRSSPWMVLDWRAHFTLG